MSQANNSFLFLSANTPWVYALSESLAAKSPVHAVRFYDWQTYWTQQPSWPEIPAEIDLRQTMKVMPTGYAGLAEPLVRPYAQFLLKRWQRTLEEQTGTRPWVIAPYFYLAPWVTRAVPPDRLVYYNLDDYTLYRPERAETIQAQEGDLVEHAAHTICLSQYQVEALQRGYSAQEETIHHFPLGVDERYINPNLGQAPRPNTVGYVGNLSDRVDWNLVYHVAQSMPDTTFVFAGSANVEDPMPAWKETRAATFSLPNVNHLGRIPQEEVTDVYWSCAVNWIPYVPDHPFNRASCPTKIMDAIASGRPVVSTPVPECTLYPEWIRVVDSVEDAVDTLKDAMQTSDIENRRKQAAFAHRQTWDHRARELQNILDDKHVYRSS